jgi:hypothetical protein
MSDFDSSALNRALPPPRSVSVGTSSTLCLNSLYSSAANRLAVAHFRHKAPRQFTGDPFGVLEFTEFSRSVR